MLKRRVQSQWDILFKKGSILWVMLKKVQIFEKKLWKNQFLESFCEEGSILWIMFFFFLKKKKRFNSLSHIQKSFRFFESYQKKSNLWVIFCQKKIHFFESLEEKSSILWVMLKKCAILWVVFKKVFGSLSHIRKNQTFGSYLLNKSSLLWVSWGKKSSLLWVNWRKRFNSLSYVAKRVQFFESYQKNSILCIISQNFNPFFGSYQRKSSILWVIFSKKKFNSLSHFWKNQFFESFGEKDVQFYESFGEKDVQFYESY